MGKVTSILQLFSDLGSQSSINQLVEISYKTAMAYLRHNSNRVVKLFAGSDLTFSEAAFSSIAPLFCADTNDCSLPIVKEFDLWHPPIQTEDDALYFLSKIIAGRVEQHISYLLKENDPFFAKLLGLVNYLIKKNGYKKINYFGKRYVVYCAYDEIKGKVIDEDSFEKLPCVLFQNRKVLLINIFTYLEEETEFFPAIPLNALVIRLRELNRIEFQIQSNVNSISDKSDIDEIVNIGLCHALKKLDDTYLINGKLNESERENFAKTLRDLAEDLKDGGVNRGLYDYLKQHIIELENNDYQIKYQNILEYLLKVMKNTISEKISEERF